MRRRFAHLAVALLAATATAAPVPREVKQKLPDAEAILGTWEMETSDTGKGQRPPDKSMAGYRLTVTKDALVTRTDGQPAGNTIRYALDPEVNPKRLDMKFSGEADCPGIYELDGDTLKWCNGQSGKLPPKGFKGGGGCYSSVLRRVKE